MGFSRVMLFTLLMAFLFSLIVTEEQCSFKIEDTNNCPDNSSEYEDEYSEEDDCNVTSIKPLNLTVINICGNITVTNASYGNHENVYHSQYLGNWSGHFKCLMPCNPLHPTPCTSLGDGACVCIPRMDCPEVGVCAMANVPLGNCDYNISSMQSKVLN
uniref:Putative secreted protein n=1 Tax=Amblyomma cajennense TaxID=34607 RepID=A0A023FE73_AMBCJ